jgi:hypothetical protein
MIKMKPAADVGEATKHRALLHHMSLVWLYVNYYLLYLGV